jgi:hypothetical protein
MLASCADMRFADNDSHSLVFWIESGCNSASTKIWMKANISRYANRTVYMYFGNRTGVSPVSNGNMTFIFFDDFTGTTIDTTKWIETDTGGYITQSDMISIANGPATWTSTGLVSMQNFARDDIEFRFKYRATCTAGAGYHYAGLERHYCLCELPHVPVCNLFLQDRGNKLSHHI